MSQVESNLVAIGADARRGGGDVNGARLLRRGGHC